VNLSNKRVFLTGATSGIGWFTLHRLIEFGAVVSAIGRDQTKLDEIKQKFQNSVEVYNYDILNFDGCRDFIKNLSTFDAIVHCAGVVENNPIKYFSLEKYNRIIGTNQTAPLLMTAELIRGEKINLGGSVVFVSSISGPKVGIKGISAYAASKAALVGMTKVLALELAPKMIRVNCVSPGMVQTELVDNLAYFTEQQKKVDMEKYPLGNRYASPIEVADAIAFLISTHSEFITGDNLIIDGGYSIQ
jgi:NAD(P)-dependent dehydrogenase (short-subunit alcohol dehydrogenase family)